LLCHEISRDTLADLLALGLIAKGPESPRAGAPNTYVKTAKFLSRFGLNSLQNLPDRESIENTEIASSAHPARRNLAAIFGSSEEAAEYLETYEGSEL
jgi:chromosome segregation and condensation protein ScpB